MGTVRVDDNLTFSARFERLRQILARREDQLKILEHEVLHWFKLGNILEIKQLMEKKDQILSTNHKLRLFIIKWEKENLDNLSEKQLYTSI